MNERQIDDLITRANLVSLTNSVVRGHIHDARNPLHALSMAMEAISESDDPAMTDSLVTMVAGESGRLAGVLDSLSRFVKTEAKGQDSADLSRIVKRVASWWTRQRPPSSARLEVIGCDELPPTVGDPAQIQQVLLSLLTNARLAVADVRNGSVKIQGSSDGSTVLLTITDNGPGLNGMGAEKAFDPFTSAWNRAGLGLTASRIIARRLGGTVRISESGTAGTQVALELPVAPDQPQAPE